MSKMERVPVFGSPKVTVYDRNDVPRAVAALSPFFERMVILALFGGWIGFWIAVVWWIVR